MLIQPTKNSNNYNNYQANLQAAKRYNTSPMYFDTFSKTLSFKAQGGSTTLTQAQLEQKWKEVTQKEQALDNLIESYKEIIEEEVARERSGFRALYGIKVADLPSKMGFGEQMTYVINAMVKNGNKLYNVNEDTPENITKALQDKDGNLSNESLKFLERLLSVYQGKFEEDDLMNTIESVKSADGLIDMGKAALMISLLAFGKSSIESAIKKVKNCNAKVI